MNPNDEAPLNNVNSAKRSKKNKKIKLFNKQPTFSSWQAVLFVVIFGLIGGFIIYKSFAATPTNDDLSEVVTPPATEVLAKRYTMQLVATAKKLQKSPGNPALTQQIQDLSAERKQALLALMQQDSVKAIQIQYPENLVGIVPAAAQPNIEKQVELQGKLTVTHGESINAKNELENPIFEYDLVDTKDAHYKIHYSGKGLDSLGGSTVKVKGAQLGADVALGSITDTQVVQAATLGSPAGYKKVAVVLLNFADNTSQPWTSDQVAASVFGTSGSTDNLYYQEASFGKYGLAGTKSPAGDVFGWYTLNDNSSSCSYSTWSSNAQKAATAAGVSLSGYDSVIYAFPRVAACSWAGLGQMPGSSVWINGYATTASVVTHELGHNFGVHHANLYKCTDSSGVVVPLSTTCTTVEYGDGFDVMGGGLYHFNNYHKGELGYFAASNTQTVTASGTYKVAPIETGTTAVQSLRVPKDYNSSGQPTSFYYLEARQPSVFDNWTSSSSYFATFSRLLIRFAPDYTSRTQSQLVNIHPETSPNGDAGLAVGETFTDSQRNISINAQSIDSTGASVQVTMGSVACVHNNPTVSLSPATQWGNPGDAITYSLQIKNNDGSGCATSVFNLTSTTPNLTQNPASAQVSLAPGASTTQPIVITSTASIVSGYYSLTETVTNTSSATNTTSVTGNYNVYSPADASPPVVTITSPANGSTIGSRTTVRASATDNVAVSSIEVYIDGVLKSSSTSGSVSFNWNSRKVTAGPHTITVKAYDAAGNVGSSAVSVTK